MRLRQQVSLHRHGVDKMSCMLSRCGSVLTLHRLKTLDIAGRTDTVSHSLWTLLAVLLYQLDVVYKLVLNLVSCRSLFVAEFHIDFDGYCGTVFRVSTLPGNNISLE
jgi:hypothetical protein